MNAQYVHQLQLTDEDDRGAEAAPLDLDESFSPDVEDSVSSYEVTCRDGGNAAVTPSPV